MWKLFYLLELGDGHEYAAVVSDYARCAAALQTPLTAWTANMHRVGQLFLSGTLTESESLARKAGVLGQKLVGIVALLHLVGQLYQVGLELEGADAARVLADAQAGAERILAFAPRYQALLAMRLRAAIRLGDPSDAQNYLSGMSAPTYAPPDPLDQTCLCTLTCIADMAAELGHSEAAAIVLRLLLPHDRSHAVSASGSIYFGPAAYWLGRLCLTLGQRAQAVEYLERALREAQRARAVTFQAWSEYYLARALPDDAAPRRILLESAQRTAHRCGMTRLLNKLESMESSSSWGSS